MKCDKLEAEQWLDYSGEPMPCYPKHEADAYIAELKEKLRDHCIHCPVKEQEDDVVAELKAKLDKAIAERDGNQVCIDALKAKLEDAQASAYAESVDAGMRERRLNRSLWLARAERAKEMCRRLLIQGFDPRWEEVERKCRAKAESYL